MRNFQEHLEIDRRHNHSLVTSVSTKNKHLATAQKKWRKLKFYFIWFRKLVSTCFLENCRISKVFEILPLEKLMSESNYSVFIENFKWIWPALSSILYWLDKNILNISNFSLKPVIIFFLKYTWEVYRAFSCYFRRFLILTSMILDLC